MNVVKKPTGMASPISEPSLVELVKVDQGHVIEVDIAK